MKYYMIRNLGYDGMYVESFDTLYDAEKYFKNTLTEIEKWDTKYPGSPSDKGIIVIEGNIIFSDHESEVLSVFEKCIPIPDTLINERWEEIPYIQLMKCKVHDTVFNPEEEPCWACYNEVQNAK